MNRKRKAFNSQKANVALHCSVVVRQVVVNGIAFLRVFPIYWASYKIDNAVIIISSLLALDT